MPLSDELQPGRAHNRPVLPFFNILTDAELVSDYAACTMALVDGFKDAPGAFGVACCHIGDSRLLEGRLESDVCPGAHGGYDRGGRDGIFSPSAFMK